MNYFVIFEPVSYKSVIEEHFNPKVNSFINALCKAFYDPCVCKFHLAC